MNSDQRFLEELDECAADAALYVLGTLPVERAQAFEQRLRSGCKFCSAQADHYGEVAEHLSLSAAPVAPAPAVRQRLLDRIGPGNRALETFEDMKIVRGHEAPWAKMPIPGVEMRPLIGNKTFMLRMQPGAVFPEHNHPYAEQCYVMEGSITDSDGVTLHAGDFVVTSGTKHDPIRSDTGCMLFITYAD